MKSPCEQDEHDGRDERDGAITGFHDSPFPDFTITDVRNRAFKYYIFDWDDNILHMPTRIYLERMRPDGTWTEASLSTASFALVRKDTQNWRLPAIGGAKAAFRDFSDFDGTNDTFLRDTHEAIKEAKRGASVPPSFATFAKTLREGRLFAVVTARGHAADTIKEAVRLFIREALDDAGRAEMMSSLRGYRWWLDGVREFGTNEEELEYYLSLCQYHAVTGPDFIKKRLEDPDFCEKYNAAPAARRAEMAKEYAIGGFVEHLFHILERKGALGRSVSVGFSDDDTGNVQAVTNYIQKELSERFGDFKFVVYDTSDPSIANGRKVVITG